MKELTLSFIGTANAFTPHGLCWNGFVANGRVLFEAPPSALMALRLVDIGPASIDTVLISHHHGDHFLGLPLLLLQWKYSERDRPINIVGPVGTYEKAKTITDMVFPGVVSSELPVEWMEMSAGDQIQLPDLYIEAFPVKHDTRLNCLGFRTRVDGRSVGYTGDSAFCDSLVDLGRGVEVLVAECTSIERPSDVHMNLRDDISRLRAELSAETEILLTHLGEPIPDPGMKGVRVADDLALYHF